MFTSLSVRYTLIALCYYLIMAFIVPVKLWAQPKFSVICHDRIIGKKDLVQIQFRIDNAIKVESINPPDFKGFNVVSGPNQESGIMIMNGQKSQYIAVGFFLQPLSTGKFKIGAATVVADGKEYKSAPVEIEVKNESVSPPRTSPQMSSPFSGFGYAPLPDKPIAKNILDDYVLKDNENFDEKVRKNIFLKLEVNRKDCYVGQPITASYKLYTALSSQTTITKVPSFNGFSVTDFEPNTQSVKENYNGKDFSVYTLRKVQLYPLQAGQLNLDAIGAENKVSFLKADVLGSRATNPYYYDILQNFINDNPSPNTVVTKNVTLNSEAVDINVKPLPTHNQPIDFKGAVGKFAITSRVTDNIFTTDDVSNLQIMVSGSGNIQLVNAPAILWPDKVEHFEVTVKDDIDKTISPMKGSKLFTIPFSVSKEGTYTIDSISFSFFDPESNMYKTVKTNPISIKVEKGLGVSTYSNPVESTPAPSGFIQNQRIEIIIGAVLILLIIATWAWVKNRRKSQKEVLRKNIILDDIQNKKQVNPEIIIPQNVLQEAHNKLSSKDPSEFYKALHTSLKKYLSTTLHIPYDDFSRKRISEVLDDSKFNLHTCLMVNELLDQIEINLYARQGQTYHQSEMLQKTAEVISLINKQAGTNPYQA